MGASKSPARPRVVRWTLDDYERMIESNMFRGQRVELIEGVIVQTAAQLSTHAAGVCLAHPLLQTAFGLGYHVRIQMPLRFAPRSAPEPDLAVVLGQVRAYTLSHPTTASLIAEVSDSSLSYDRRRKGSLYARYGIADYWIVNLRRRQLEVYRNPVPDPARRYGFGYADVTILQPADRATPLAAPQASILVADLLP